MRSEVGATIESLRTNNCLKVPPLREELETSPDNIRPCNDFGQSKNHLPLSGDKGGFVGGRRQKRGPSQKSSVL